MSRILLRQLRQIAGIADDDALRRVLGELREHAKTADLSPAAGALLGNLETLLNRIDGAYGQHERDLALRTRSLELSSAELSSTNDRLRNELASRNRALKSLRETALGLLGEDIGNIDPASLAGNDLESLSVLMAGMIEQREAQRRELDNQKFALDQHAIVSITDTDGIILYANPRFCEISGHTLDELVGHTHAVVSSGIHPPALFAEMWATISAGKVWHGELCNRKKSGEHYWVAATIVPFLDTIGRPMRYIGIRTDITERKAIEARLQAQLRLVEELIEAIPLPLYLKDCAGRYQRVNRAFEIFFSVRREDILGQTAAAVLHPDDIALHAGLDAELLGIGGNQTYEARITTRDGIVHDTIYRKAALTHTDGSISGLLGTIVDITERKTAEQALRTAMEAAEAANTAKSAFLANMSHEIRTPMNGIIGMTALALGTNLDDEQRDYLQIVNSSAEALLTVINDILDFSKIEAGKMLIEQISFHLPGLLADTTKMLALRAHEKQIELILDVAPGLPSFVIGDPGRLRQVLTNLIGNAIKFTERGEVVVRAFAPAPGIVRIAVRDTGVGIAQDKQGLIFDAFAQEDSSTTRRFGGTGLGLTISNRLVAMMNGRLWVDSSIGMGSTFHIELPLPADDTRRPSEGPLASLAGIPVLLVDDNETNRRVLAETLDSWGMRVQAASSGAEALALLRGDALPRVIILDAHMPDMDGQELAQQIQADPRLTKIPRIMLSSLAKPGDAERCRLLGIAAYFSKPFNQQELLAGLHSVLLAGDRPAVAGGLVTRHSLREEGQSLDVLLVEDHPINQKLATNLLEKWGHQVTLAENGRQALDRVAEKEFDVILMDLQMPEMGGIEATQHLRLAGCDTYIVAVTANAMEGDREFCLAAGMNDYIAKPIKADDLYAILRRVTPAQRGGPPAVAPSAAAVSGVAFDYAAALAAADPEIVEVIAPLFLDACADDLDKLRQALADADIKLARRQAHTLRGLVGNFNAEPVVTKARRIEDALQHDDVDAARRALPAFEAAFTRFVEVLREHCQVH